MKKKEVFYERSAKALTLTLILIGIIFGIFVLVGEYDKQKQATLAQWPTVSGKIISADIWEKGDYDDESTVLRVWFSYIVYDFAYTSSQDMSVEEKPKYPQGSSVTVYYDPTKPKRSYLDAGRYIGPSDWGIALLIYPIIGAFIGIIYLWVSWVKNIQK